MKAVRREEKAFGDEVVPGATVTLGLALGGLVRRLGRLRLALALALGLGLGLGLVRHLGRGTRLRCLRGRREEPGFRGSRLGSGLGLGLEQAAEQLNNGVEGAETMLYVRFTLLKVTHRPIIG